MNETLRVPDRQQRILTLCCQLLLICSPFLLLVLLWAVTGHNSFTAWPVWSDELDYWRSLYNWNSVGFSGGYSGMFEATAQVGTQNIYGLSPILLYGWFVKLFGLSQSSIVIGNAVWISLGALVFCLTVKPKPLTALAVTLFTVSYVPAVLYACTSMTELFNYGVLLIWLSCFWCYCRRERVLPLVLTVLCALFLTFYRTHYALLLLPAVWVFGGRRFGLKTLLGALAALLLTVGCGVLSNAFSAPYLQGFLYNFTHTADGATALQMLLSHTKANLQRYFTFYRVDGIQWAFRQMYMLGWGLCLLGTFLRLSRKGKGLRLSFGLNNVYVASFLWLTLCWGWVVMFQETMDWVDFRLLAPVLWIVPIYLLLRGHKAVPAVMMALSLVLLVQLCMSQPLGVFADEDRFTPPETDEKFAAVSAYLTYNPNAEDPFENSVRTDLNNRQLNQLDAGLGLEYGWFMEDSVGKSRWLLTDTLKTALNGYEPVYRERGIALYRLSTTNEEP